MNYHFDQQFFELKFHNIYKGTVKKDDIPAATQLFTTDWVVRYMVDNSLGRYWIERNPESKLQAKLQYFVTPQNGKIEYVNEKVTPEEMTFFDPCMGSGHILVYAFDVLMEIYRECGYVDRDAAQEIIEKNLFGLDIDNRAYQLAYFAIMMKARSYDRRFLTRKIQPNVAAIVETNAISQFFCEGVTNDKEFNEIGEYLIQAYKHAKEIGSLLSIEDKDYIAFKEYLVNCIALGQITMDSENWYRETMPFMKKVVKQAKIMAQKYSVVSTNPPYMNKLEGQLKKFVIEEYKPYSGDLFSVFMYKNFDYCKPNGYSAFMTPFVWMFIKTYEQLREYIIGQKSITTLVQMEYSAFEEATVPICSFVLKNGEKSEKGLYFRLSDFKGGMDIQKQKVLDALCDKQCDYFYETSQNSFSKIPSSPIAYWVSERLVDNYSNAELIDSVAKPRQGMATCDNNRFLRLWHEVSNTKLYFSCSSVEECKNLDYKWFPYNKGGDFRKWYGNNENVINWEYDGQEVKEYAVKLYKSVTRTIKNIQFYFQDGITYTFISSSKFGVRYSPKGFIFDVAGSTVFTDDKYKMYILAFMISKITKKYLDALNPTLNFQVGDIKNIPIIFDDSKLDIINKLSIQNIEISKTDWDTFETSWDFITHPMVIYRSGVGYADIPIAQWQYRIEDAYNSWESNAEAQFIQLKHNEIELNRIFIDIYGLQNEVAPEVEDRDITIRRADLQRDIKSFISYAVGCMFGRYSLDENGLVYAGSEWDASKYRTFIPDKDNCIPITDEEYFEDDIMGLFIAFVKKVYGEETLEENLGFIANVLGNKSSTSREIIRNYFIKDFYKDHVKTYQKRPIYWLYDSGKNDGFKALVYMHRYNIDTTGIVRVDYLHKMQKIYMGEIDRMQEMTDNSSNTREVVLSEKRKEKLIKQLKETKEYDEKIAHLALSRIAIDLDDGIRVNYEKIQTGQDGKKLDILGKI